MTGLFLTGTDTGVGKTTVACGLLRLAFGAGRIPMPYKPVETGCAPDPRDAQSLHRAAFALVPLADVCPYPLALPAAPAAAAAAVGLRLDIGDLSRRGFELARRGNFLLVEGAGGLLAPYDATSTNADLAAALGLPILVVARTALGTINHTALTVAELDRRGLPIAGVILVRHTPEPGPHESTNAGLIESLTGRRPLGTLPHLTPAEAADPDAVAAALALALAPEALARLLGRAAPAA